jgi:hypothetical protein
MFSRADVSATPEAAMLVLAVIGDRQELLMPWPLLRV